MLGNVMPVITGELTPIGCVTGVLISDMKISGELSEAVHPTYDGPYTIVPSMRDQVLETKKKVMKEDINVLRIPVAKTENKSGGYTVVIGG